MKELSTYQLEVRFQRKMELVKRVQEGSELAAIELSELEKQEKEEEKKDENEEEERGGRKMKCPKCGEGEIRDIGFASSSGRAVICDKCGTLFSFEENKSSLAENEKAFKLFWKSIEKSKFTKEEFLRQLKHRMPTLEEFREEKK
ncbi:MAG: hypothetical protein U9P90_03535 [Patescibacteria group bacterium]|nr:hypothetical protein [Patescibacteria group bacterium]